jgi:hypothetical protein
MEIVGNYEGFGASANTKYLSVTVESGVDGPPLVAMCGGADFGPRREGPVGLELIDIETRQSLEFGMEGRKGEVMTIGCELGSSRRAFLGRMLPACAVTCLGLRGLPLLGRPVPTRRAQSQPAEGQARAKHKFDEELPMKPTFRQLIGAEYSSFIPLVVFLSDRLGKEAAVQILKDWTTGRSREAGADTAKRLGSDDFSALKKFLAPDNRMYKNTLTMEVVESTDAAHELKVTECLWADTFLRAKAGELGYAAVCFGDYAFAQGFSPKIGMVRDKTLMQGHPYCNHRYLWKA